MARTGSWDADGGLTITGGEDVAEMQAVLARLEVAEARGDLDIVYPLISIRAEPHVAVVDGDDA